MALGLIASSSIAAAGGAPSVVRVTDDKFEPTVTVVGPETIVKFDYDDVEEFFIRSFVDKRTKHVDHQIYFSTRYDGPERRRYDAAFDDRTTEHPVLIIERKAQSCRPRSARAWTTTARSTGGSTMASAGEFSLGT